MQNMPNMPMVEVFYSYAEADVDLLTRLENHMASLPYVQGWSRRQLVGGDPRAEVITAHLNTAHIILLLISPEYIAALRSAAMSSEQRTEMERAMARQQAGEVCVIPILLRPAEWQSSSLPFSKLHSLPAKDGAVTSWGDRDRQDKAFTEIVQGVHAVAQKCRGLKPPPPPSPSMDISIHESADTVDVTVEVKVIAVMGTKGGVGKGLFVSCTAQLVADAGHDVAIIDLDLSTSGTTRTAKKFHPVRTYTPIKTVYDHLAPHANGFGTHRGNTETTLWDITPDYLDKPNRGKIFLLPAREDVDFPSSYEVVANIYDPKLKSRDAILKFREAKLVVLIREMIDRIREECPHVRCILIDCGADSNNPIYSAAFANADYRYILTIPDDAYFPVITQIQKAYWQRHNNGVNDAKHQEIFVVLNRVKIDDTKRYVPLQPKGYIPLNPDLEKDIFAGGSLDYDLGYNNIFTAVLESLPEELRERDHPLLPDPIKVRLVPWLSRFVADGLAERTLHSRSFFWRTWLLRGVALVSLLLCLIFATRLFIASSLHTQLDVIPLAVVVILLAISIPLLWKQEQKRLLLLRIARLQADQYELLAEVLRRTSTNLRRWLNDILQEQQKFVVQGRRRELSLPE